MANDQYKQGKSDASQNKGPKSDSSFNHHRERESYNAGYNQQKQQQNNKK